MKAMIMAAGLGTRLRPLTNLVSKPMVQMAGRPCLEHTIRLLRKYGITDIVINLHYMPEMIRNHFGRGENFGVNITYSYEEELLGTAGGVKNVEEFFEGEPFLVVSGDALTDINLDAFYDFHKAMGGTATLALKKVPDPTQYGVVLVDNKGYITDFQEKPAWGDAISKLANTGIYLFEPDVFRYIPEGEIVDFGKQVFPEILEQGDKLGGYIMRGYWCDIGNLEVYREAHYDMLTGLVEVDIPGKRFESNIWIGERPVIHPDTVIVGPVVIGDDSYIGKGAQIYGPVVLDRKTTVSEDVVIKRGIFWENVYIGPGSQLNDCIVGEGCQLKPDLFVEKQIIGGEQHEYLIKEEEDRKRETL